MDNTPFLKDLANREPWRQGVGLPGNALDPTWEPGPGDALCDGEVDWEPGTRWWFCKKCGRVGSIFRIEHTAIKNPVTYLTDAISFFLSRRKEIEPKKAIEQMCFVAGTAIRYAAVQTDIGKYVEGLVTK